MSRILLVLCAGCLVLSGPAFGAWSSDPALNLVIADGASDQILPKLAPTALGGSYVSWFNGLGTGYDVRVQRLDGDGDEILPHNGVLVADRNLSWVTDYGLDIDAGGNAIIAFQDDRFGGVQISASRIAPDGTFLWGTQGVQLTNTTDFVASPMIAGTSDGGIVVAWTQESSIWLQKLDAAGNGLWGPGLTFTPATGSYSVCDLHDAGTDVIVSFVHQTGGFGSPRHLLAQKFDANGNLLWGAAHVAVFDGGSLQFGNFPSFTPDGAGGAVFSWYDASTTQLQCYAQRIRTGGTEAFPHNGTAVSTNTVRVRVSPWASFNLATQETFVFWREQSSSQSQSGLYGQKLDSAGSRQWGNDGRTYIALGSDVIDQVRCLTMGDGAFAYWVRSPSFGQDRVQALRVDTSGTVVVSTVQVSSTPSGKSRLAVARDGAGFAILAWSDARSDEGDIYAQNVNPDGTLGVPGIGVGDGGAAALPPIVTIHPNPARSAVTIDVAIASATGTELVICDARGRAVRKLVIPAWSAGGDRSLRRIVWDGNGHDGTPVGAGVYFVHISGRGAGATPAIVHLGSR